MQEEQKFGTNWKVYWAIFFFFLLILFSLDAIIGLNARDWLFFSIFPASVFSYLFFIQNKIYISPTRITQHFLCPFKPEIIIEIDQIEWVALKTHEIVRPRIQFFFDYKLFSKCTSFLNNPSAIIKLKNGQVCSLKFTLLADKKVLEAYFEDLNKQIMDHDTELFKLKDLQGFSQLAIDATLGLTDLVEAMHQNFTGTSEPSDKSQSGKPTVTTRSIYKGIRTMTSFAGGGIDELLAQISPLLKPKASSENNNQVLSFERAALLSALNGILGDYMAASNNPMTLPMRLRSSGRSLTLSSQALSDAIQPLNNKILVLVHGLCMNDLQWNRKGHDHGAALAMDLGYTPIYLRYNTGKHISTNGRSFSDLLEIIIKLWPEKVQEMVIIGHSMGGLVSRSACHYAGIAQHSWLKKTRKMIFLGSPHHGAPLERGGNWIDSVLDSTAYTAPLARLGKIRSSGITDLRYGNVIDEHWQNRDRFERSHDVRIPVPLPQNIQCFAIAGTIGNKTGDVKDQLLGDGLVQVKSALGQHKEPGLNLIIPQEQQWLGYGINHLDLLNDPKVYSTIKGWLS